MDCTISDGNCVAPSYCIDAEPAAWLILQSFSNFHVVRATNWAFGGVLIKEFMKNLFDAMGNAETPTIAQIGTFTSTFSPTLPPNNWVINTILDVVDLAFGLFAAGIWNSVDNALTQGTKWGSTIQWASALSSILSGATAFTKDNLPA